MKLGEFLNKIIATRMDVMTAPTCKKQRWAKDLLEETL